MKGREKFLINFIHDSLVPDVFSLHHHIESGRSFSYCMYKIFYIFSYEWKKSIIMLHLLLFTFSIFPSWNLRETFLFVMDYINFWSIKCWKGNFMGVGDGSWADNWWFELVRFGSELRMSQEMDHESNNLKKINNC